MNMLLTNAMVFLCLGSIWKTDNGLNTFLKCAMLGLAVWNFAAYLR
jgi:hypothetical protein